MPSGYKKNYNNHSVFIPAFKGIDTGLTDITFGGFEMDKFINSQPSAVNEQGLAWYDVAHSGAAGSVPGISKPGDPAWDYVTFPQSMIAAANKGKGFFLSTDVMWASVGFLAKKNGTLPHGNDSNLNPPSDGNYPLEIATLDKHLKAESPTYNRALPGSGPATWAHNHLASGVYDLNGLVYEWVCMMMDTNGYPQVSANLDLTYGGAPFGRGTVSSTSLLTADGAGVNWKKEWETWLAYDAEEAAFTAAGSLLGMTSGATAHISQVIDLGTTGYLRIRRTSSAAFQDNEVISSATAAKAISGAADNGAGLIRIKATAHGYTTGQLVTIKSVGGTVEANNTNTNPAWTITVHDVDYFDLNESTFANAYTSGGSAYKVTGVGGVAAANGTEIGEFAVTYLGYDGQTAAFALGDTVTGETSTHTGVIVSDSDCGTFGTLGILGATGVFQDDENLQVGGETKAVAVATAQSCKAYIPEATGTVGASYAITASTPNTLTLDGTPADGVATFWIHKTITRDITLRTDTGLAMTNGHKIDSLRDADNDLKAYAIPGTSSSAGSATYGNAYYYFDKSAARAAFRGGSFYGNGGVFALAVGYLPSDAFHSVGFRAGKVL
jgi:hypothetical protein